MQVSPKLNVRSRVEDGYARPTLPQMVSWVAVLSRLVYLKIPKTPQAQLTRRGRTCSAPGRQASRKVAPP